MKKAEKKNVLRLHPGTACVCCGGRIPKIADGRFYTNGGFPLDAHCYKTLHGVRAA